MSGGKRKKRTRDNRKHVLQEAELIKKEGEGDGRFSGLQKEFVKKKTIHRWDKKGAVRRGGVAGQG